MLLSDGSVAEIGMQVEFRSLTDMNAWSEGVIDGIIPPNGIILIRDITGEVVTRYPFDVRRRLQDAF